MPIRLFILTILLLLIGCKPSGPITTNTKSTSFATLAERTEFLHQYVSFRRTYETLDFNIMFQNNGGGTMPGPSDYDVRLVATVPASELQAWVPASGKAVPAPDISWLTSVPTALDLSGVSEWYVDGMRVVGIDRSKHIVVYRLSST